MRLMLDPEEVRAADGDDAGADRSSFSQEELEPEGTTIPPPKAMKIHISEDEVVVHWENPEDAPSEAVYNVQMGRHGVSDWTDVSSCMGIERTYCILSSYISDYTRGYKVRVQLMKGDQTSKWEVKKKFLLNEGNLQPPSFTLSGTSSKLTVYVHEKPILRKIFPYGVAYILYLEDTDENKTTRVRLRDDEGKDQRTNTFTSLHSGKNYCIKVEVEDVAGPSMSSLSPEQCLVLPENELYIIAASSLSILGILAFVIVMSSILLCYLKRPAKTPIALKSTVSGWQPLSVTEGTLEVVTDKGWYLTSYKSDIKTTEKLAETNVTTVEKDEEENRRTSLDSGVSMEVNSAPGNPEQRPVRQEDSGCGSMGGPESSADCHIHYPLQNDSIEPDDVRKREDSGMGMSCQLHSSSLNLDCQDSEAHGKTGIFGNYRTQSPSDMQIQCRNNENMLKQIPSHSMLAEVVSGYKPGPQSCICSGTGQCSWCHRHGKYGPEPSKLCRTVCIENVLLGGTSYLMDLSSGVKTHMDSVITNLEGSFLHVSKEFPLMTSKYEQDSNMNNLPLSLCDVQLTTD